MYENECMCDTADGCTECGCEPAKPLTSGALNNVKKYESHNIKDPSRPYYFHLGNYGIMPHWHENIEILRFLGVSEVVCDRKEYKVNENSIVVVNSNSLHASPGKDNVKHNCLIIDTDFLAKSGIDVSLLRFDSIIEDKRITELFDTVEREVEAARNGAAYGTASVQAAILTLTVELCRSYAHPVEQCEKNGGGAVRRALGYIKSHLDEHLSVDMIAQSVNVSKYYFCREFHRETGLTVVKYINNLRCREAQKLIGERKYPISEIARMCGFENASYFSRIYKQIIGETPSESGNVRSE